MEEVVIKIVADQMKIDPSAITLDFIMANDDRVDSIDRMEVLMALEQEFNVAIDDDEVDENISVGGLVSLVQEKQSDT